jgi:hypothetical protein
MSQNARQLPARSTDSGGVLDLGYVYDGNANVASITDYTTGGTPRDTVQVRQLNHEIPQ